MRLIIPQKLIESVRRDLVIHYEALGVLHLTHSGVSADSLESKLLSLQPDSDAFYQEMERQTDLATWKGSRICVVLNHQLFNLIDSLLEWLVLEREGRPQGAQEIDGKIQKVIKYLKVTTIYATHIYYFSSVDRIVSLFFLYQREKNLAMLEEIIAVIITLTSKHNNEKKPNNVQGLGMENFHKDIGQVMDQLNCLLRSFDLILDLTMSKDASKDQVIAIVSQKIESLQQQLSIIKEGDVDKKEASLSQLRTRHQIDIVTWIKQLLERPEPAQTSLEDASVLVFRSINTYLNVGDLRGLRDKYNQTTLLETLLPPRLLLSKLTALLQCTHLSKRVHIQAMNTLFLLMMLEMNPLFACGDTLGENNYYIQACQWQEVFVQGMQKLARWHAAKKLQQQEISSLADTNEFLDHQWELVGRGEDNEVYSEAIKSQRYFNCFLNFLSQFLAPKNRALHTQMYPQLLKPLLAIIYVEPEKQQGENNFIYPININCQLKSAKVLKEVVKMSSMDDPGAVEKVIHRLRGELQALHIADAKWGKHPDDDCEAEFTVAYRHDMIRTLLRFLSYSIIRNDPNAINFTQNFVANSRKILESDLIQVTMMDCIFKANMLRDNDYLVANVDPVILQCIQMISYLFNDLPQKISLFIENGLFPGILESLAHRMPIQADMVVLILKLLQTLCLNGMGKELVVKYPRVIEAFCESACNISAFKHFVNSHKVMLFTDTTQQVITQSKPIALLFVHSVFRNFELMCDVAWRVTDEYVKKEKELMDLKLEEGQKSVEKDQINFRYEKKQGELELGLESCSHVLWFIIETDGSPMNDHVKDALLEARDYVEKVLTRIITTPIIASACNVMFPIFIEAILQILVVYSIDVKVQFMKKVLGYLTIQLDNMAALLNEPNFDEVADIETQAKHSTTLNLYESDQLTDFQQSSLTNLRANDQASIIFGKVSFYCDIIQKCNPDVKSKVFKDERFEEITIRVYKLQALINRYHACKYKRDIHKELEKLKGLTEKHPHAIEETNWTTFVPMKGPLDDIDELKNLHFKYEVDKIASFTDARAKESYKTTIELSLDENISHTSNICQQSIRKMILSYLRQLNRWPRGIHFGDRPDTKGLHFNQLIGKLMAEEFKDFENVEKIVNCDETDVMRVCCQFSAVFSEFNKVLFGNFSTGALLIEFLQQGGLNSVEHIILWLVEYIHTQELKPSKKSLNQCKNIQLLWSHIIDFFIQLVDAKYLDQQSTQFLVSFKKPNPSAILAKDSPNFQKELYSAKISMRAYFLDVFTQVARFLFIELNHSKFVRAFKPSGMEINNASVFLYFSMTSDLFFASMIDLYSYVSKGLQDIKAFQIAPLKIEVNQALRSGKPDVRLPTDAQIKTLTDMGFEEHKSKMALFLTKNDVMIATEMLMNQQFHPELSDPLPRIFDQPKPQEEQSQPRVDEKMEDASSLEEAKEEMFVQEIKEPKLKMKDLIETLEKSFGDYLGYFSTSNKLNIYSRAGKTKMSSEIIDNIFFKLHHALTEQEDKNACFEFLLVVKRNLLDLISDSLISQDINILGTAALCLNNILSYQHSILINEKEVFNAVFELISITQKSIAGLQQKISYNSENPLKQLDKQGERAFKDQLSDLQSAIHLFMYITEEGKISSDLSKLENILSKKSAFDDTSFKDIEDHLEKLNRQNQSNVFHKHKEQTGELFHKITLAIIDLFKSLHQIEPVVEQLCITSIQDVVMKSLECLNFLMNVRGFPGYDCQQTFLKNEGLRALFGIRSYSQVEIYAPAIGDTKKMQDIHLQSKILIQMLSQNENSQIKVFENLIKSVLFIFFQERLKSEDGLDMTKLFSTTVEVFNQSAEAKSKGKQQANLMSQSDNASASGKKQALLMAKSPAKKPQVQTQQSNQKTSGRGEVLAKSELGEAALEDFINFFNYVMKIQDFRSFLLACQNVCVIKKRQVPINEEKKASTIQEVIEQAQKEENKEEEKKEEAKREEPPVNPRASRARRRRDAKAKAEEEEKKKLEESKMTLLPETEQPIQEYREVYYIALNSNSLKEMVSQFEKFATMPLNLSNPAENEKLLKGQIHQFQQEIVNSILEQFIEQTKESQIMILSHCKQKLNPSSLDIVSRLDQNGHLIIKNAKIISPKLSYTNYFFDYVTLLNHLSYLFTHSPILVRSMLKHKDGKTFKFIIRNLYFLITMTVDDVDDINSEEDLDKLPPGTREYKVWFDHSQFILNKKRLQTINEFFKRCMFDNPHLTLNERRAKQDARILFSKEALKNLIDHAGPQPESVCISKFPLWPQLKTVFNLGALWIMSLVLREEDTEDLKQQMLTDKIIENLVQNMQKFRNIYRSNLTKVLIYECQQISMKPTAQSFSENTLNILKVIQLIQLDCQTKSGFFDNQRDPLYIGIQMLNNLFKPFESSKAIWGNSIESSGDLGFMSNNLSEQQANGIPQLLQRPNFRPEREDQEMNDEDEDDSEEDDSDSDSDEDDLGGQDDLLDSDREHPHQFRFSQVDGREDDDDEPMDDEYGEEDQSGLVPPEGNRIRGAAHHHHHHHDDDEEDDELPSDSESYGNEGQEVNPAVEMILNSLNQGNPNNARNELIDFINQQIDVQEGLDLPEEELEEEEEEGEEEMSEEGEYEMDIDEYGEEQQSESILSVQPLVIPLQNANREAADQDQQNMLPPRNIVADQNGSEEGEAEFSEERSFADGDESDYSYNQEIDDEEEDMEEIIIGRNPSHLEQLSHIGGVGGGGPPGGRRDNQFGQRNIQRVAGDMLSMNNMSIDLFNNIGGALPGVNGIRRRRPPTRTESEDFSQSAATDMMLDQDMHSDMDEADAQHRHNSINEAAVNTRHVHIDNLEDIVGVLLGGNTRPKVVQSINGQQGLKEDIVYKPVLTMLQIVELGKDLQRKQELYRGFIKDVTQDDKPKPAQAVAEQTQTVKNPQTTIPPPVLGGTTNPFAALAASNSGPQVPIFGEFNPNTFSMNRASSSRSQMSFPLMPQRSQQAPSLNDIELDPEFLANLDESGRQNLEDTESMMNQIQAQSRYDPNSIRSTEDFISRISNRQERERLFRHMPENVFQQLSMTLQTEGLIYRRLAAQASPQQNALTSIFNALRPQTSHNSNQSVEERVRTSSNLGWNQMRSRLQSHDQQLDDITDFAMQSHEQPPRPVEVSIENGNINATFRFFSNPSNEIQIAQNGIFNSFQQYLQDQLNELSVKPTFDQRGVDTTAAVEILLYQTLMTLGNGDEITDQNFEKVNLILDMIMVWVKNITNVNYVMQMEHNLIRILSRVPNVRQGFFVKCLQWMSEGMQQLLAHVSALEDKAQQIQIQREEEVFAIEKGSGLSGKMEMHVFMLQCLKGFKQMSQETNSKSVLSGVDLVKVPLEDAALGQLIKRVDPTCEHIMNNQSILSQIVLKVVGYFSILNKHPGIIIGSVSSKEDQENSDRYWEEIVVLLSSIFKQVQASIKAQADSPTDGTLKLVLVTPSVDPKIIEQLCDIILTTQFKSRTTHKAIKSIFSDIQNFGDETIAVQRLFQESLSGALRRFVEVIEQAKISPEQLKKEVTVINSILKFAKASSNNSTPETVNICDQDLFFRVVESITGLIDRKQFETLSSSMQQTALLLKDEFRTVISTLFTLFEYNLKFIFTDTDDTDFLLQSKRHKRNNQPARQQSSIEVQMQAAEEIKAERQSEKKEDGGDLVMQAANSKDRAATLIEAIDQHLKLKIKDEHAREDERLKVFIRFCLEHKKVINSFIRANQQVLNDSLRNVIMKVPMILDFDNKRLLFRSIVKKMQKKYRLKYFDVGVSRQSVFDESYEQMKNLSADRWKGEMAVEFADEQGIDEGGLTKEWFILISQEIFNPDRALFIQSNAGTTYYPNPNSSVQPEYVSLFKFIGRIVGKALYDQQLLDCYFVKALYKIMLGMPLTYHDVEDFDNDVYRNLKWCLDNSVENLGLSFSEVRDYFGKTQEIELVPGGKDMEVTDENKYDYVQKSAYQKLYVSIKRQIDAFLQGFYDIVPKQLVQIFDNRELELLISGLPNIDIMDLRENTLYQNYTAETPVVKWLFEVLEEFDNSERAEFIQFVTGSSKVPVEGFKGLRGNRGPQKFQIVKFFTSDNNRLPQAHTCFKQLELPEYSSKAQLKERLLTAIKEGKTFGFA